MIAGSLILGYHMLLPLHCLLSFLVFVTVHCDFGKFDSHVPHVFAVCIATLFQFWSASTVIAGSSILGYCMFCLLHYHFFQFLSVSTEIVGSLILGYHMLLPFALPLVFFSFCQCPL